MSGYRYVDVGIYATYTPWIQLRPEPNTPPTHSYWPASLPRNTNSPKQFSPVVCPPIARPLAPTPNAPFRDITNRNHGGPPPLHSPLQSIARRSGIHLHYDYPIGHTLNTMALVNNRNNAPQYPPGLGWESVSSPRGFYSFYRGGNENVVRDADTAVNSNSLVARSFKYRPSVARFDPFRDDDVGMGMRGYPVDTKAHANLEASLAPLNRGNPPYIPPSPPHDVEVPSLSWQLEYPSYSPRLYEHTTQALPKVQRTTTPTPTQKTVYTIAPISPPVRPNQLKSRVSNAFKARARNDGPSSFRFNLFGNEASGVDAGKVQLYPQPQDDLKVPIVPVQPINVPDDPVLAALHQPWAPVHLVGLPSNSPHCSLSPPVFKLEDPVFHRGSDSQWGATPAPIQNPASTYVPFSPAVRFNKSPGTFMVVKELQSGAFGQAVAVCELGNTTRPRLLCLKVFRKNVIMRSAWHGGVNTELKVYKRLAEADPLKKFVFLMKIDAALQDDSYLYFAMVSSLSITSNAFIHLL